MRNEVVAELIAEVREGKLLGARETWPSKSWEQQQQMEKNKQEMRGAEAKRKQKSRRLRSERLTCPRKEPASSKPRNCLRSP